MLETILDAETVKDITALLEFIHHEEKCKYAPMDEPCTCGLDEIRSRIYAKLEVFHAREVLRSQLTRT